MHALKDLRVLDADRGHLIDVEKPAVVDLVGRDSPIAEPIGLLVEKRFQAIETGRFAAAAVELEERRGQRVANFRACTDDDRRQTPPRNLLLAITFLNRLGVRSASAAGDAPAQ